MRHDDWAVRPATPEDADALSGPILGCGLFSTDEAAGFLDMVPDQLADPGALWWVAEKAGIQGAAYATRDGMSEDVWNLWFIGLAKEAQGAGGGSALMTRVEADIRAKGGRILLVETSGGPDFAATRQFYAGLDYAEQGRIADYYGPGEAKVIFAKVLVN
ncbi:MAG: GNAT family N-acetyltransferase [Pseudomonadota bacterium]